MGQRVAVIGGGNTAIDVARCLIRMGKRPIVLYRRTQEEMPAFEEEVQEALEEGVEFQFLASPLRIREGKGEKELECVRMRLAERDETGRRKAVPVTGSTFLVPVDSVIIAAGEEPDLSFLPRGIKKRDGLILTRAGGMTSVPHVFAGGDFASKERTVAHAIGSGKRSAVAIDCFLRGEDPEKVFHSLIVGDGPSISVFPFLHGEGPSRSSHVVRFEELNLDYFQKAKRQREVKCPLEERIKGFFEITSTLSEKSALEEAGRCFHCGTCDECGNCYIFCPDASIRRQGDSISHEVDYDFCKGCGICVTECPRRAISLREEAR